MDACCACQGCVDRVNEVALLRAELSALQAQVVILLGARSDESVTVPPTPVRLAKGGVAWEVVKKGPKGRSPLMVKIPIVKLNNRFQVLPEEKPAGEGVSEAARSKGGVGGDRVGRTRSVLVVGDSNVKRIDSSVYPQGVSRDRISIVSLPGAGIDDVKDRIEGMVQSEVSDEVLVVLHVGVNDVDRLGSEIMLKKFRDLALTTKNSRQGVSVRVCTIPERSDRGAFIRCRAEGVNERLAGICSDVGAEVLDWRSCAAYRSLKKEWYVDGLHYGRSAGSFVGSAISCEVKGFLG